VRNMSFMLTTKQMMDGTKTVTRRVGWWMLKAGDVVMAVEKGMGLKRGEKVKRLYPIEVVSVRKEPLINITDEDIKREGFPDMSGQPVIEMFCKSHKCDCGVDVNRIEFRPASPVHNTQRQDGN